MTEMKVKIDARPQVWGDSVQFLNAPERGSSPKSKVIGGKEHDPDELIPESIRHEMHHREWRQIQEHTSPGKEYDVLWVHGLFVDANHSRVLKQHAHFESWFLIVDDGGHFIDVPASLCTPCSG